MNMFDSEECGGLDFDWLMELEKEHNHEKYEMYMKSLENNNEG
jgi:hypothetical protein